MPRLALTVITCSVVLSGCIWEDRCVDGAVRVDGHCMFVEDGGADAAATDAEMDAAQSTDANPPEDASDAPSCVPIEEVCNGTDDDCDLRIDEGVRRPVGAPVRSIEGQLTRSGALATTVLGDGSLAVIYESAEDLSLYVARLNADGSLIGSPATLATGAGPQAHPVVSSGSSAATVVVWNEDVGSTGQTVRARVIDDAAIPTGAGIEVTNDALPEAMPAVAIIGDRVVVVWRNTTGAISGRSYRTDLLDGGSPVTLALSGVPDRGSADPQLTVVSGTPEQLLLFWTVSDSSVDAVFVDRLSPEPLVADHNPQHLEPRSSGSFFVSAPRQWQPGTGESLTAVVGDGVGVSEVVTIDPHEFGRSIEIVGRASLTGGSLLQGQYGVVTTIDGSADVAISGEAEAGFIVAYWNVGRAPGTAFNFGGGDFVGRVAAFRTSIVGGVVFSSHAVGATSPNSDLWLQRIGCM